MLIFLRKKCKIDLLIFTFFISVLQLSVLSIQSFNFQFLSMQDSVKPQLWVVVNVTKRMLFLFLFFINYGIKRKKKFEKKKKKTFSSSSSSILDSHRPWSPRNWARNRRQRRPQDSRTSFLRWVFFWSPQR